MNVNTLPHYGISFFFFFHFALFIGNTYCEKDFEAVKSNTRDFRKATIEVAPWLCICSPCEGASGGELQQLLPHAPLHRAPRG